MGEVHRFRRIKHAPPKLAMRQSRFVARQGGKPSLWHGLGLASLAFVLAAIAGSSLLSGNVGAFVGAVPATDAEHARFTYCIESDAAENCVIDGDTFRYRGRTIRIADIDTPEVTDYGCAAEKTRGDAATRRLATLLNAGPFTLGTYERDVDRYGRLLRIVTRDGGSLGMQLVVEGHARVWDGARRSWCG